jgi:DNA mismatch repair protein MutL
MSNLYSIFGRDVLRSLVEVSFGSEECTIKGYAGKPEIARGNRNSEIFFVNNRYIKSKILTSAVEEAYKPFLMQHRFPFAILYLDIPPQDLDVNIHPSKTEIRFIDERYVYSSVVHCVTEAIITRELIPEAKTDTVRKKEVPFSKADEKDTTEREEIRIPEPFETKRLTEYKERETEVIKVIKASESPVQETLFKEGFLSTDNLPKHRIIGQVFDTYWIIEFEGKMYIIDQHAAHEKVLYERLSAQIRNNDVYSQMISPPYILSLTSAEESAVSEHMEQFEEMGFHIEHFGGREYALSSVPTELFGLGEAEYFLAVVDDLVENDRIREPEAVKDRIATMSCKAAIKGNMNMSYAEADALIKELLTLENPYNCPHGRPVIVSYSKTDLEKMFKRIV